MACGNVDEKTTFISTSKMNHFPASMTVIAVIRQSSQRALLSAFNSASGHKQNITGTANIAFVYIFSFVFCFILQNSIQAGSRRTTRTKLSVPSRFSKMTFMKIKRESNYATSRQGD